jgi:CheY-like chemotaxis protein
MSNNVPSILVIEDEPSHWAWIERILSWAGYKVELAKDGREALLRLNQGGYYSLLVIDLVMPVMSGFEVLDELQRRGVEFPTLITSGIIVPEIHHYLKTRPRMALMSKPLEQEAFLETVRSLIQSESTSSDVEKSRGGIE